MHIIFLVLHHHFHYASLHLSSTPDSKPTYSTNPSTIVSLAFSDGSQQIFMTIAGLNCSSAFCFVFLFSSFLFDTCHRLS